MSGSFLPGLAYEPTVTVALGQPVDIRPTQVKSAGAKSFSIVPALPSGLAFSTTTGRTTGTASAAGVTSHEVTLTDDNVRTGSRLRLSIAGGAPPVGFTPLVPARILDTRGPLTTIDGLAAGGGPFGPNETRNLQVTGRGGVPSVGAGAVVLNVTVTAPTSTSFLTVYPTGTPLPVASNLNFVPGQAVRRAQTQAATAPAWPRITRDTICGMAEASVRDLRNHGGEVLDRVLRGERVTVTRDGTPVAELRPIPGGRLSAAALVERFRALPPIEPSRFRADVDAVVEQTL